jgi:hypothetical protein
MDKTNTTTPTLEQTDEEILTCEVSDEALEAAAGEVRGDVLSTTTRACVASFPCCK